MSEVPSRKVDMSPEAVDRRLREASQLSKLCLSLRAAALRSGLGARKPAATTSD
jgi:hypothetical protein